jgi:hypothetical protein
MQSLAKREEHTAVEIAKKLVMGRRINVFGMVCVYNARFNGQHGHCGFKYNSPVSVLLGTFQKF